MAIDLSPGKIGAKSGFEVMRQNCFEVVIGDINADDTRIAVTGVPFPKFAASVISLPYKNTTIKLAGKSEIATEMTVTMRDVTDGKVRNALWAWCMKVYNTKTGKIGRQGDYKKNGTLFMSGPDGGDVSTWSLMGIWPSAVDFGSGAMDSAEPVIISATLSVDMVEKQ